MANYTATQIRKMFDEAEQLPYVQHKRMMAKIEEYLESIGFTDPPRQAKFYYEYVQNEGTRDAMGLIDPHEIEYIREIVNNSIKNG